MTRPEIIKAYTAKGSRFVNIRTGDLFEVVDTHYDNTKLNTIDLKNLAYIGDVGPITTENIAAFSANYMKALPIIPQIDDLVFVLDVGDLPTGAAKKSFVVIDVVIDPNFIPSEAGDPDFLVGVEVNGPGTIIYLEPDEYAVIIARTPPTTRETLLVGSKAVYAGDFTLNIIPTYAETVTVTSAPVGAVGQDVVSVTATDGNHYVVGRNYLRPYYDAYAVTAHAGVDTIDIQADLDKDGNLALFDIEGRDKDGNIVISLKNGVGLDTLFLLDLPPGLDDIFKGFFGGGSVTGRTSSNVPQFEDLPRDPPVDTSKADFGGNSSGKGEPIVEEGVVEATILDEFNTLLDAAEGDTRVLGEQIDVRSHEIVIIVQELDKVLNKPRISRGLTLSGKEVDDFCAATRRLRTLAEELARLTGNTAMIADAFVALGTDLNDPSVIEALIEESTDAHAQAAVEGGEPLVNREEFVDANKKWIVVGVINGWLNFVKGIPEVKGGGGEEQYHWLMEGHANGWVEIDL